MEDWFMEDITSVPLEVWNVHKITLDGDSNNFIIIVL